MTRSMREFGAQAAGREGDRRRNSTIVLDECRSGGLAKTRQAVRQTLDA
jgi:hypothetical protein